ncbi:MAG TPA: response regulator, partial [Thermodesulfobacteriota bacterium]|nr:response regulator [Thermodesulfobacteriota bacterium]
MAQRILVVEDELDMLEFLTRFLSRKGYQVDSAPSGEEAWKAIGETVYDLIISDLALQDISGIELLERVRTTDAFLPFIIMTGVGTIESAVEAIKRGAFHYLTKPFKVQDMELLARRAME